MKQVDRHIAQIQYVMTLYFSRHERRTVKFIQKSIRTFLKQDAILQKERTAGLTIVRGVHPFRGDTMFRTYPQRRVHLPLEKPNEK